MRVSGEVKEKVVQRIFEDISYKNFTYLINILIYTQQLNKFQVNKLKEIQTKSHHNKTVNRQRGRGRREAIYHTRDHQSY